MRFLDRSKRDLTILGRIQIVKTFVIPIFMYRAGLICVQKDIVIEVNKLLFKFIWKGKDKVKRLSLICDLDRGGLKAPHLESIIKSQRIIIYVLQEICRESTK